MKTPKIADSMVYIGDDLIAEALAETPRTKQHQLMRWCAIAACLALLISAVTVAATTDLGAQLLNSFSAEETKPDFYPHEEGYELRLYIKRIPTSDLKGDIQEVPGILREKMANPNLFSSLLPNSFLKKFASLAEAEQYIGLSILQVPDWDWSDTFATLCAHTNDASGEIAFFYLEQYTRVDNIGIQYFAEVYTEHWDSDVIYHRLHDDQSRTYTESFYTTTNGLQCHIIAESPLESGYQGMTGFIVQDGIKYRLHVSYQAQDADRAERILHEMADQFK